MKISWRWPALAALGVSTAVGITAPGSTAFGGTPRVGALFPGGPGTARHSCTAAVVNSPEHNLIVTAAHCLGTRPGAGFAPGYRDGRSPYGNWLVTEVYEDPHWRRSRNPDYDVAFARTAPARGTDERVQDAVGAESIGFDPPRGRYAVAVGYPSSSSRPVYCGAPLRSFRFHPFQLRFDCPGLPGGTSGGPFLVGAGARAAGRGTVVGVIGGYQEGGDSPDVSYTAYFGPAIAALYREALREG